MKNANGIRVIAAAALAAALTAPVAAREGAPLRATMASADPLRAGQPVNVLVVLEAAKNLPLAEFRVEAPADWQVLDGQSFWAGPLAKGGVTELQFRAAPLTANPGPLSATLRVAGYPEQRVALKPERLGGRFPERMNQVTEDSMGVPGGAKFHTGRIALADDSVTPGDDIEPRLPGEPRSGRKQTASKNEEPAVRKAQVRMTATGRFTFVDDRGERQPVRRATVEAFNRNQPAAADQLCARGLTNDDGEFTLTGTCGDLLDGPDVFVRLLMNNSVASITPDDDFAGNFIFTSAVRNNVAANATVAFGTLVIGRDDAEIPRVHNLLMRAHDLMRAAGEKLPQVNVRLNATGSFYIDAFSDLHLEPNAGFDMEFAVFHEYGHHVLTKASESPAPDYDNGLCDFNGPGHCIFVPEKGVVSWTEGWPNFFALVLTSLHDAEDRIGENPLFNIAEAESYERPFAFPGQEDQTEGIVAAILWDLFDTVDDDQEAQGPGRRDRMSLSFAELWQVVRDFDPSRDPEHNHPVSIHEFYDGLRALRPELSNAVAEVFGEHNIRKPQPDLVVESLGTLPASANRGGTFAIANTVVNAGDEAANNGFSVRFEMVAGNTVVNLGRRTIAKDFAPGGRNAVTSTGTFPATMTPGNYRMRVCADSGSEVPESDEGNNCRTTGAITIQ